MVLVSCRIKRVFVQSYSLNRLKSLYTARRIANCKPGGSLIEVIIARTDSDVRKWLDQAVNDAAATREKKDVTINLSGSTESRGKMLRYVNEKAEGSAMMSNHESRMIGREYVSDRRVCDNSRSSNSSRNCSSNMTSSSSDGNSCNNADGISSIPYDHCISSSSIDISNSSDHRSSGYVHSSNNDNNSNSSQYAAKNDVLTVETAKKNCLVVGFDVEWRPYSINTEPETLISLIQLATDKSALLIQMKYFGTAESRVTLTKLLDDDSIIKVGVSVLNDLKKLEKDFGMCVAVFLLR